MVEKRHPLFKHSTHLSGYVSQASHRCLRSKVSTTVCLLFNILKETRTGLDLNGGDVNLLFPIVRWCSAAFCLMPEESHLSGLASQEWQVGRTDV